MLTWEQASTPLCLPPMPLNSWGRMWRLRSRTKLPELCGGGNKKGGYSRLSNRFEALLQKIDFMYEPGEVEEHQCSASIERPLAFRYHFIEICGVGKVSSYLSRKGWNVGPAIDLDRSKSYDLAALQVLRWLYYLIEEGLLDSYMVEPPCTRFSPAPHPCLRSYKIPTGFEPQEERIQLGTELALRALSLILLDSLNKHCSQKWPGLKSGRG